MKRRTLGVAAVAVVAGAAGAAWWRAHADRAGSDADVWQLRFPTPQGASLELAALRGRPLLLNFWATWCPPCVGELPLLDRFEQQQAGRGWQVVGLAVDNLAPVLTFLGKQPVRFPIGLAGMEGVALARQLGNTGGALPFTVVFDRAGSAAARKLGVISPQDLQSWVETLT